jgi:predicted TIM-barrel fold metal-dependent hydrolase
MNFVDCDSHLRETMDTWSYLSKSEEAYRPKVASFVGEKRTLTTNITTRAMWVVGDTWTPYQDGAANQYDNANIYDPGATEMTDVGLRLQDLDALGIDVQLLFSSFFIGIELDNPNVEAALARSFNRWAAAALDGYGDRLRWALRPPLRTMARTLEELDFGAAHGASGIHIRGIEHGMFLSDEYFYPMYERAEELGLAILIHVGASHRRIDNQPIGQLISSPAGFIDHIHKVMAGFHSVLASDLHKRFPGLRWGFLEGGSTWIPTVLQQQARLAASGSARFLHLEDITPELLEAKNLFVACEVDEDLPYLTSVVGENVLCAGTDYGHNDIGTELAAHSEIMHRPDLDLRVANKIANVNGRRLLGLPITEDLPTQDHPIPTMLPHTRGASTPEGRPILTMTR